MINKNCVYFILGLFCGGILVKTSDNFFGKEFVLLNKKQTSSSDNIIYNTNATLVPPPKDLPPAPPVADPNKAFVNPVYNTNATLVPPPKDLPPAPPLPPIIKN